uniref:NOF-FB transposable element protein n=1 Tax=Schizaphis graminum TaxID=13262 RepID=A0A2S2NN08_SCHGA
MDSCCGETTLMRTLKNHIFIDVESFCPGKVFQCYLQELPKKLNFENYEYILTAAIAHVPGHYLTYVLRLSGSWEQHNDLEKKVKNVSDKNTLITPHIIMYIKY